jgi:HlyD family secretion protein
VALLIIAIILATLERSERSFRTTASKLKIETVRRDVYRDFIPLRAAVVPLETIYLDAMEGGRVEKVLVEPGDWVSLGQPLIVLSNTDLELTVLDREARLIESITQLQSYQTQLEQNHLNNEKALVQIDYNVVRLKRSLERRAALAARGAESKEVTDAIQDELNYSLNLRPLQARGNEQQDSLRLQQLPQIRAQLEKLHRDVEITRSKLENLTVRAPAAGRMTALDLKVGENRNRGERLGEITPESGYKLSAQIDEYYLGKLRREQTATASIGWQEHTLRVARIYPLVKDGAFRVDLLFGSRPPEGLLPGQTVQGRITLAESAAALILPSGPYLESTGGDWVFVLASDGQSAGRRHIRAGRRNIEQVEVLGGLRTGDRVITSDYRTYDRIDRIDITP